MVYRVGLLCQFRNPEPYFSVFHAHHARLFDELIYIDHKSDKDFRDFRYKKTIVYRVNINNFVKDVYYSKVIEKIRKELNLDFLFILDIDEFIPYQSRSDFHEFLSKYESWSIGTLYWKNGYARDLRSLEDCPRVLVQRSVSETKKIFFNLRRVKRFYPNEGNHNADYPFLGQTFIQFRRKRKKDKAEVIHIPIASQAQIGVKISTFPWDFFARKLEYLSGINFGDLSNDELQNIVGNYRSSHFKRYTEQDFHEVSIFADLDAEVKAVGALTNAIEKCNNVDHTLSEESIAQLRTRGFGRLSNLRKILTIDEHGLIFPTEAANEYKGN